ncbi:MAG: alpha/beta fold hydrolase [Lautropia sp.]
MPEIVPGAPGGSAGPRVLRGFVDTGATQLHYRRAGVADGPPIVMLHKSPGSGLSLVPLLTRLARQRPVIVIDTPGNGDSEPVPTVPPTIADYATTIRAGLDALGIETCDLYGLHTGASIAIEIALSAPATVRRLILEGVSLFDPAQAEQLVASGHAPALTPSPEATHLLVAWHMVRDGHLFWPWQQRGSGNLRLRGLPSAEELHAELVEVLKALDTYHLSYEAALRYRKRDRLSQLHVPTLVCAGPRDQLVGYLDEVAALIPGAVSAVVGGFQDHDVLDATADRYLAFFDGRG